MSPVNDQNTPVGTTLFDVVATDADGSDAGTITYSIDEVAYII